jgi:predicted transcriptional regulator
MVKWRKNKARSKMEIYLSILRAILREKYAKPTRIMYKSNTSWLLLQQILSSFTKNNLIGCIVESGRKLYFLTDDGKRALETLEAAYDIVKKINVNVGDLEYASD